MTIPILGQDVLTISAQARLNAKDNAAKLLAEWQRLGLRHGRSESILPVGVAFEPVLLIVDELVELGCELIGMSELLVQHQNGLVFLMHLLWRLPRVNPG